MWKFTFLHCWITTLDFSWSDFLAFLVPGFLVQFSRSLFQPLQNEYGRHPRACWFPGSGQHFHYILWFRWFFGGGWSLNSSCWSWSFSCVSGCRKYGHCMPYFIFICTVELISSCFIVWFAFGHIIYYVVVYCLKPLLRFYENVAWSLQRPTTSPRYQPHGISVWRPSIVLYWSLVQ